MSPRPARGPQVEVSRTSMPALRHYIHHVASRRGGCDLVTGWKRAAKQWSSVAKHLISLNIPDSSVGARGTETRSHRRRLITRGFSRKRGVR